MVRFLKYSYRIFFVKKITHLKTLILSHNIVNCLKQFHVVTGILYSCIFIALNFIFNLFIHNTELILTERAITTPLGSRKFQMDSHNYI